MTKSEDIKRRPILVIEDNSDIREVIRALLELEGYAVHIANDGQQALTALRGGLDPGLIILDLTMPGTDGYTFRREQLGDPTIAHIPVIVCSGDSEVATKARALGVAGHYHKPIEIDEFLDLVSRFS